MIYVMSDIHGNLPFFRSVMKQIRLRKNDTLYILGDVIDRHPDGIKILKYIMKKANIRMLLGNHEYMMLNTLCKQTANGTNYYRAKRLWMKNGGKVTLDAFNRCHTETQEAILSFLKSLPLSFDIRVNDIYYKLVHGAPEEFFATSGGWYYGSLKEFCVWHRLKGTEEKSENMDYTLIFGHTPTCEYQSKNPPEIWTSPHGKMIGTDCGSGFPTCKVPGEYIGRLACLRLDDGKAYYSDAEEGNKPEAETDNIIDNAAKRILEEYRDAFTELAKGSDD